MSAVHVTPATTLREGGLHSIGEVTEITGITRKQLRYWDDLGLVPAKKVGKVRAYGSEEIERLRLVVSLMEQGYTPGKLLTMLQAQQVAPDRPRSDRDAYEAILRASLESEQTINVGNEWQSYNSAYKRLRRVAEQMGLRTFPVKEGEFLKVRSRKA